MIYNYNRFFHCGQLRRLTGRLNDFLHANPLRADGNHFLLCIRRFYQLLHKKVQLVGLLYDPVCQLPGLLPGQLLFQQSGVQHNIRQGRADLMGNIRD